MTQSDETMRKLQEIIRETDNIVFFGGAGVSTASGIPDFRSPNGLYHQKTNRPYPPEYYFSHEFCVSDPDAFADFTRECWRSYQVAPSGAHLQLAEWEKEGKLKAIVTQNIDGLHQRAGSKTVYEVHGNMHEIYCPHCGNTVPTEEFMAGKGRFPCPKCGHNMRAAVTLYGEMLPEDDFTAAIRAIKQCRTLIVGGSSLVVYPAAGLIDYYRGKELILINFEPTPADARADYVLHGDISQILPQMAGKPEAGKKAWL